MLDSIDTPQVETSRVRPPQLDDSATVLSSSTPGDTLTILTSAGPRLTKVWDSAVGKPLGYERAQQVSVSERTVSGIRELSALLTELESQPNTCLIRGKFIGHAKARELYPAEIAASLKKGKALAAPKEGFTLRRLNFFTPQKLHFFYIDIDKFVPTGIDPVLEPEKAIDQYIIKSLPPCFQAVTYHWQLSSGAGHPDNAGVLKAHVAFCLATAIAGDDLELWVKALSLDIDVTVFRTVQPNYTAAPVFINGVHDPVPVRSGLCESYLGIDEVDLVIDPALLLRARSERKQRQDILDPSEKDGPVGLFCRTYSIEEVVERWLSDVFEFNTEWRMTWLQSTSGAAEGCGVTDNRQGIFNTHSTDPLNGRAANKWDLVRHYKYAHLDSELDPAERVLLGIGSWPSNLAMLAMVKALPEMQTAVAEQTVKASETHRSALESASTEVALRVVAQRIALDGGVDFNERLLLAGVLQLRFRQITGHKHAIGAMRSLLTLDRANATELVLPDWAKDWAYVTGLARYFSLTTKSAITREAFDSAHGRLMPANEKGIRQLASKVACDEWQIPVVDNLMYLPSAGELFSLDGKEFANTYQPSSAPGGIANDQASGILARHLVLTIPDAGYRKIFVQWMAWVVRNPGLKVKWAVFLKGVEGDGKSVIGAMLTSAMGGENVDVISSETLAGSNFNDWAAGKCVNILEEIKLVGHGHNDVLNKLKPLISNPRVEVHGKGRASMTAINTVNYIGFSNHEDALPLDTNDRRHFVLFTPWKHISELHSAIARLNTTPEQYWTDLWSIVNDRPELVRGFFDAVDLAGFDPNSRAPQSSFKDSMVQSNDLDDAEANAKFYIEEGYLGVSKDIVSSGCLTKALAEMNPPVVLHTSRVRKLLSSLGYVALAQQIKWNGYPHRVWVPALMRDVGNSEAREMLDRTKSDPRTDFLA